MVQSGNYRKQGTPSVETHNMNFVECIVRLEAIIDTIKPHYPTATVVNTRFMHEEAPNESAHEDREGQDESDDGNDVGPVVVNDTVEHG